MQALSGEYDIVGIQEHSNHNKFPPCPASSGYTLFFSGRAAVYVKSQYAPSSYTADTSQPDVVSIRFKDGQTGTHGTALNIICVYNSPPANRKPGERSPLAVMLEQPRPPGDVLLMGDTNLHHPAWDPHGREMAESAVLLQLAEEWRLNLDTPCKLGLQGWVLLREQWARGGVNNACGCNTRVISEELESGGPPGLPISSSLLPSLIYQSVVPHSVTIRCRIMEGTGSDTARSAYQCGTGRSARLSRDPYHGMRTGCGPGSHTRPPSEPMSSAA